MTERVLHPEEVATVFGASVRAVKYGALGQELPWRRAGRLWWMTEADLRRYLRGNGDDSILLRRISAPLILPKIRADSKPGRCGWRCGSSKTGRCLSLLSLAVLPGCCGGHVFVTLAVLLPLVAVLALRAVRR